MNAFLSKISPLFLLLFAFLASAQVSSLQSPAQIQASDGLFTERIEVKWSRVGLHITYNIWRSDKPDPSTARLIKQNYPVNIFADQNAGCRQTLTPGKQYYYWVEAVSNKLKSRKSHEDAGSLFSYSTRPSIVRVNNRKENLENLPSNIRIINNTFNIAMPDSLKVSFEIHNPGNKIKSMRLHFFISKDADLDVSDEQIASLEELSIAPNGDYRSTVALLPGFAPKKK